MVHHAICTIFSVHQYPCTKNNRVPKCSGTYPSFLWYNTYLYQKNDTYYGTYFEFLVHYDLLIIYYIHDLVHQRKVNNRANGHLSADEACFEFSH